MRVIACQHGLIGVSTSVGRFLESLGENHPAFSMTEGHDGLTLVRRDGQTAEFDEIARDLLTRSGDDYMVFLSSDGLGGYERALVVPFR